MARKSVPTGQCTVCRHPERGRIDYLAATGQPVTPLAVQFGVNHHALRRHFANHVTDAFKSAAKVGPFVSEERLRTLCSDAGVSVVESLQSIYTGLFGRWLMAFEAGNDHAVVTLTRAMHENLRMRGQITRELMPGGNVTVNAFVSGTSADWLADFSRDLLELIRTYPEIRTDLTAVLRRRMAPQDPPLIDVTPELAHA